MSRYNRQIVDDENNPIFVDGNPAFIKQSETIGEGSLYGALTLLEQMATPVRLGETNLEKRHSVLIINSGSTEVYVGFDDTVTGTNGIPIAPQQERVFSLNPTENLDLFIYSSKSGTVKVVEVK